MGKPRTNVRSLHFAACLHPMIATSPFHWHGGVFACRSMWREQDQTEHETVYIYMHVTCIYCLVITPLWIFCCTFFESKLAASMDHQQTTTRQRSNGWHRWNMPWDSASLPLHCFQVETVLVELGSGGATSKINGEDEPPKKTGDEVYRRNSWNLCEKLVQFFL